MNSDIAVVLLAAVLATLNPTLLAAVTVMLLLPRPKRLMLAYLLGAYTSSLAAGLAIVLTLHGSAAVRTSTHVLNPGEQIAAGAVAVSIAFVLATGRDAPLRRWRERRRRARRSHAEAKEPWQTRMLEKGSAVVAYLVGAAMSFPGVTYVNALDHIARLNPSTVWILLLIAYFCIMQQIFLEGALLASTVASGWTQHAIVGLKVWFARHGRQVATAVLSAMGTLLATRGVIGVA